jgi:hypothetical protein
MPLDPPRDALGKLMFDQGGKEPGRGPALLVGPIGEVWPQAMHRRQTQFCEHDRQPRRLDLSRTHVSGSEEMRAS